MTDNNARTVPLTIAIVSRQYVVWLGLQKILEDSVTIPMVVLPYHGRPSDLLRAEGRTDVFIVDLETERDVLGTITQIREAAPASKIVLLCGLAEKRTDEAFSYGVDGIILTVQPPAVVLAVMEALSLAARPQILAKRECVSDPQPPAWPDALTEREREIIRLVEQGLSNKDIAYTLSISDSTVRHHMTNIFDKVGVPNRQRLLIHSQQVRSTPV